MAVMGQSTVGPTSENLYYGDAVVPGVLQPQQFHTLPVRVSTPSVDSGYSGYIGPLGNYGNPSSSGSLYGYGATSGVPR